MSAHTPGPWHVDGDMIRNKPDYHYSHSKWLVRLVPRGEGVPRSEKEYDANARLIAAAPELAEALRALIDDSWSDISGQPCVPSKSTVVAARAALAKAGL